MSLEHIPVQQMAFDKQSDSKTKSFCKCHIQMPSRHKALGQLTLCQM